MPKKTKVPEDDQPYTTTLKSLKRFIKSVETKYGKKVAHELRVELHHPREIGEGKKAEIIMVPGDVTFMGVGKYKADKANGYPSELVVVIK